MKRLSAVLVIITLLATLNLLYINRKELLSSFHSKSSNSVTNNETISTIKELEDIRNRPFPLAGYGNDAGMETGDDWEDIPLRNREPPLETYSVGTSLTTRHGVRVDTKFYYGGDQITNGYGFSEYNPSPKTKGVYTDAKITLENLNKKPFELVVENIVLVDQEKREYFPIKQTKNCGFEKTTETETDIISGLLNPNVPCTVNLLFEVATSTNSFHVRFDIN